MAKNLLLLLTSRRRLLSFANPKPSSVSFSLEAESLVFFSLDPQPPASSSPSPHVASLPRDLATPIAFSRSSFSQHRLCLTSSTPDVAPLASHRRCNPSSGTHPDPLPLPLPLAALCPSSNFGDSLEFWIDLEDCEMISMLVPLWHASLRFLDGFGLIEDVDSR
ncbi:uncharacterized protein LOC122003642 [Zingiber officinale]|uniref:uncharacterized protein LOC122003642 n=1 Tax=Zingiber officinale TaxID=94328 RepID=UPI001C4B1C89|nr:uncharacterized protein LOC122003642 [Zingiber officinale]